MLQNMEVIQKQENKIPYELKLGDVEPSLFAWA